MSYSIKRAASYNFISYIYLALASFFTTPILIRGLGITEFSRYILAMGIFALCTTIDLGISRSVTYHLASKPDDKHQAILSISLLLHVVLGLTYFIITSLSFSVALGIMIFVTYLLSHFQTLPESRGNFGLVNTRAIIIGSTNTLIAAILSTLSYQLNAILSALTISTILTLLLFYYFSKPTHTNKIDYVLLKKIIIYGFKVQWGKLVNSIESQYPKFILATNPAAITIFALASNLTTKAVSVVTQLSNAIFPASAKKEHNFNLRTYWYIQLSLLAISLTFAITFSYWGYNLLVWWLKDQTLASSLYQFLLIYRYYAVLLALTPLASTVLDSRNLSGLSSLYASIALLIELIVVALYYPYNPTSSIAYGSTAGLLVMVPVLLFTTQKNLSQT